MTEKQFKILNTRKGHLHRAIKEHLTAEGMN